LELLYADLKSPKRVLRESRWKDGAVRGDPALDEARTAPSLGSPTLSVRKLRIAVESMCQFAGVEASRHFKRPDKPDRAGPLSPWPIERRALLRMPCGAFAFFRARDDADHAAHDKLKSFFAPGEVKARPLAGVVG
jgi:hypothetical protein